MRACLQNKHKNKTKKSRAEGSSARPRLPLQGRELERSIEGHPREVAKVTNMQHLSKGARGYICAGHMCVQVCEFRPAEGTGRPQVLLLWHCPPFFEQLELMHSRRSVLKSTVPRVGPRLAGLRETDPSLVWPILKVCLI